jgi:hypothetical protein
MSLAWYARMLSRRCSPAVIASGAPRRTRGRACGRASRARCAAVLATGVGVDGCRPVSVGVGGILAVWRLRPACLTWACSRPADRPRYPADRGVGRPLAVPRVWCSVVRRSAEARR